MTVESFSRQQVLDDFGISEHQLRELIKAGRVSPGYRGRRNEQRFLIEHYEQIRRALSAPLRHLAGDSDLSIPGMRAPHRRRKSA